VGSCPECKAKIGGLNHAPAVGNRLAREMDDARASAYTGMDAYG